MADLEDEVGDIIAKARRGLGVAIDALARATDISPHDIESIEAYKLTPTREQAMRIAEALSLSPERLADIAAGAWQPNPVSLPEMRVLVECVPIPYGAYGENCYILGCRETNAAAVIDPGGAVDEISRRLSDAGLNLDLVLITHAHADHIGGLKQLLALKPDARLVNSLVERESVTRGLKVRWEAAKDGLHFMLGDLRITALATPGHTPGSTCYLANGVCFVGDTLFAGSIGRPAGREDYRQMLMQIHAKVLSLPDETTLLPGHGPATTVGEENAHNPFF